MLGMARTDWRCKVGGKTIQYLLRMFRNFFPAVTQKRSRCSASKKQLFSVPTHGTTKQPPPDKRG